MRAPAHAQATTEVFTASRAAPHCENRRCGDKPGGDNRGLASPSGRLPCHDDDEQHGDPERAGGKRDEPAARVPLLEGLELDGRRLNAIRGSHNAMLVAV